MGRKIASVRALEILDSRGNPTVRVHVTLDDGVTASASVPSDASTGENEALEVDLIRRLDQLDGFAAFGASSEGNQRRVADGHSFKVEDDRLAEGHKTDRHFMLLVQGVGLVRNPLGKLPRGALLLDSTARGRSEVVAAECFGSRG